MNTELDKEIICNKLEQFRNKGGAWQSQHKAKRILAELRTLLHYDDWCKLYIGHSHYLIGEGAGEMYDVIGELINKYCNNKK